MRDGKLESKLHGFKRVPLLGLGYSLWTMASFCVPDVAACWCSAAIASPEEVTALLKQLHSGASPAALSDILAAFDLGGFARSAFVPILFLW